MTDRSYLSIREVLDLLVAEFPDVTISKIRFLESRGLIHPERTPSGYRKFYEEDVERLRWILGQQRENFLPLKVIKRRLDASAGDGAATDVVEASLFEEQCDDPPPEGARLVGVGAAAGTAGALVASVHAARPGLDAASGFASAEPAPDVDDAMLDGTNVSMAARRGSGRHVPAAPRTPPAPRDTRPAATGAAVAPSVGGTGTDRGAAPVDKGGDRVVGREPGPPGGSSPRAAATAPAAPAPERNGAPAARKGNGAPAAREGNGAPAARGGHAGSSDASARPATSAATAVGSFTSGASLNAEELASASGVDVGVVAELEEYGLVSGRTIAGVRCYDEDALVVARLAAGFRAFGIESRHLRAFKSAAERQAGLFSQVVTPYLRQRNPAARERAHDSLEELASLGAALQAALLRAELRDLTGG